MRYTRAQPKLIFREGNVLASGRGTVVETTIQQNPDSQQNFLIAVVEGVDEYWTVTADIVYVTSLDNPTAWVALGSFSDYSSDGTSSLPYQTDAPSHYFFNASV